MSLIPQTVVFLILYYYYLDLLGGELDALDANVGDERVDAGLDDDALALADEAVDEHLLLLLLAAVAEADVDGHDDGEAGDQGSDQGPDDDVRHELALFFRGCSRKGKNEYKQYIMQVEYANSTSLYYY